MTHGKAYKQNIKCKNNLYVLFCICNCYLNETIPIAKLDIYDSKCTFEVLIKLLGYFWGLTISVQDSRLCGGLWPTQMQRDSGGGLTFP